MSDKFNKNNYAAGPGGMLMNDFNVMHIQKESVLEEVAKETLSAHQKMDIKAAKLDYSLIPAESIESLVKVLMFGAKKYAADGWKQYPDQKIYTNAIERHMAEIKKGKLIDPETGESHFAAIMCSAVFLEWHRLKAGKNE